MSKEVVAEVIALIELGMIAPEDIVKCLRKANSEPEKALVEQPAQQEPVALKPCWYESKQEKMCRKCGQVHAEAIPPAQYFDEVVYDGKSTAEALKRFQENVQPVDELIHAWQALEETSGHVLDEGDVEGRMHMSVIRSAWEQMDSLVRDMWEERGRK